MKQLLIGGTTDSLDGADPAYRGQLGEDALLLASLESLVASRWPSPERNLLAGCNR
jgi:hypothetical protein